MKPTIFVAMSFHSSFRPVYDLIIKQACEDANVQPWRGDDEFFIDTISQQAIQVMDKCDYFIADLTDFNKNVMFEAGYLYAKNKKGIFISQEDFEHSTMPIYMREYPVYKYDEDPEDFKTLRERITIKLQELTS